MFLILKLALIQSYSRLLRNAEVYTVFRKLAILERYESIPYFYTLFV